MPESRAAVDKVVRITDHPTLRSSVVAERGNGTQAVERAALLLRVLGACRANGASLSQIVSASGLSKPTVRRLLVGMMRQGLVEQDERDRRYYLGSELFVLGSIAALRFHIGRIAQKPLQRLAQISEDTVFLSVARGSDSVCVHREEGRFPIRTHALNVGDRHPLGIGAGSLALLSAMHDDDVERIVTSNARRVASSYSAAFASERLREHVARTRANGFAFNPGLLVPGSCGIAVAIVDSFGDVAGALSIAAIEARMSDARRPELVAALHTQAHHIASELAALRGDARMKGNGP